MGLPEWVLYGLVLLAAAAHAGWNALLKLSGDQLLTLSGLRMVGFVCAVILLLVVPSPAASSVPYLVGNVGFMYAYYYFLTNSYRTGEFSSTYPIARGFAPLVVLAASVLLSIDQVTLFDGVATLFVTTGIMLFCRQNQLSGTAVSYALATGCCIAGYSFLAGIGVRQSGSVLGYLAWSELLTGLGLIPVAVIRRRGRMRVYLAENFWRILVAGMLAMIGFGITLLAFNHLPLAPVTAIRESGIAFAVFFGFFFLNEKFGLAKGLGLISVLIGVTIIAIV